MGLLWTIFAGNSPIDWLLEVMFVLMFGAFVILPIAFVACWATNFVRRKAFGKSPLVIDGFFIVLGALFLPPHLYMTYKLTPVKLEFKGGSNGGCAEVFQGPGPGEFDCGGHLDRAVNRRIQMLTRNQYIPIFTARWHYDGLFATVPGMYVYTFLPKSMYDGILKGLLSEELVDEVLTANLDAPPRIIPVVSRPTPQPPRVQPRHQEKRRVKPPAKIQKKTGRQHHRRHR